MVTNIEKTEIRPKEYDGDVQNFVQVVSHAKEKHTHIIAMEWNMQHSVVVMIIRHSIHLRIEMIKTEKTKMLKLITKND